MNYYLFITKLAKRCIYHEIKLICKPSLFVFVPRDMLFVIIIISLCLIICVCEVEFINLCCRNMFKVNHKEGII